MKKLIEKVLLSSLILFGLFQNSLAYADCMPWDNHYTSPDYCMDYGDNSQSCWVSNKGMISQKNHCCYYSDYSKEVRCYDWYPNQPKPRRDPQNPDYCRSPRC